MNYKIFFALFITILFASPVSAATPTLSSYTVSPSNASSGQLVSLSWTAQDAQGASLLVSCVSGVKVKKEDGSIFPCDTKTSISGQSSDSLGFFVVNTSGTLKTVTFTLYPKDSSGADTSIGQSRSVTLSTMPYPISTFSASATTTKSLATTTLTWNAPELDGVNIQIACVEGITVFQDSVGVALPCGQLVFATKQGPNSNVSLLFKNRNIDTASVKITLLPYVSEGAYDLIHSESLVLDVVSDKITPTQLLTFVATPPRIVSDDNMTLLWTTKYTSAVTFKVECVEGLSVYFVTSTTTAPLACGKIGESYSPNSNVLLSFINTGTSQKTAFFTLYPQLPGGGFDGINTMKTSITVLAKGQVIEKTQTLATSLASATTLTGGVKSASPVFIFSKLLRLGTKNTDVTELQKFLSKDKVLYPEGVVSGYFGPATQRAVGRFQVKYGIAKSGEAGYGQTGPKTREKLNGVQ